MKNSVLLLLLICVLFSFSACSWVGETAGKTQAGIENSVDSVKQGYKKGYSETKQN